MTTSRKDEFQKRARRAILSHAFFRLESGLTIALTLLLAWFLPRPFAWWRGWYWLVLGSIAWALIVITSITDESSAQVALLQALSEAPRPPRLHSPHYRQKVEQALEYRQKIEQALLGMRAGLLRDYLLQTMVDLSEWLRMIYALAERLDIYERDEILKRDAAAVQEALTSLQRQLRAAPDEAARARLESLLAARREQKESLDQLQGLMAQAQFRLEETLSALGTAYSQFLMIGAQKAESTAHRDLARRMQAQVQELEDILASMQQVYEASHGPQAAEVRTEE